MTPAQLGDVVGIGPGVAWRFAGPITDTMARFEINTPLRQAAFLAQTAHESGLFTRLEEDLDYSAGALLATWPLHFNTANAGAYAHNPQKIADRAYADRMGNGDEASGDGWRFRGRGLIQLTGKDDYRDCGLGLDLDLLVNPDLLLTPENAALAAGWEWGRSDLNALADKSRFVEITRAINGGLIGEEDREELYQKAREAFDLGRWVAA